MVSFDTLIIIGNFVHYDTKPSEGCRTTRKRKMVAAQPHFGARMCGTHFLVAAGLSIRVKSNGE